MFIANGLMMMNMQGYSVIITFLKLNYSINNFVFFSEKILDGSNGSIADNSYNLYKVLLFHATKM